MGWASYTRVGCRASKLKRWIGIDSLCSNSTRYFKEIKSLRLQKLPKIVRIKFLREVMIFWGYQSFMQIILWKAQYRKQARSSVANSNQTRVLKAFKVLFLAGKVMSCRFQNLLIFARFATRRCILRTSAGLQLKLVVCATPTPWKKPR